MNCIILLPEDLCAPARVRITDRRREHVLSVHRAAPGDTLRVGLLGGGLGSGTITALDDTALEMDITLESDPPAANPCVLVVALCRPKSMRKVLHAATTMGVKRICFINAHRVDKSYWQTPRIRPERLREVLLLGLEQCVDTILPEVTFHKRIRWFIEDDLPGIAAGRRGLIAHPAATQPCPRGPLGPSVLLIGPEGGFVDYEVEYFTAAGFTPVSMGVRLLRVEEAVAALLGRIG